MSDWQPIETAPRDGTPILLSYAVDSNDVLGYAPWDTCPVVIGWWEEEWRICFMYDGAADTEGYSSQFFHRVPLKTNLTWMPLPKLG